MTNFDSIESQLENIIATACEILEVNGQELNSMESINKLLTKRDQQLQTLYQAEIKKHELTKKQKNRLRDFFTRFYLVDKKMNKFFAELSLNYKSTLGKIEYHKKAKKAYKATLSTSRFLDAQITG